MSPFTVFAVAVVYGSLAVVLVAMYVASRHEGGIR